ncbi:MAG: tripartite tricarboxylate transporter substrate binding protein [Burkholderiales bacterium]|nr:tripartite tricarboxylate transporter substrate binding protein [Burkholderiales bacterium]
MDLRNRSPRRRALSLAIAAATVALPGSLVTPNAAAQGAFPAKPIEVIVPWAPGGSTDLAARALAAIVNDKKLLPQPMQVVNKPGGSAIIGSGEVANGSGDGHQILYTGTEPIVIQPLVKETPYKVESFTPVLQVVQTPLAFVVNADAPWKSMQELVAYARANPKKIRIANPGPQGWSEWQLRDLVRAEKLDTPIITFEAGGPAITAQLGGHTEALAATATALAPHVRGGKFRVLASMADDRLALAPGAPTLKELGFKTREFMITQCFFVPAKTSPAVVKTLHDAIKVAMETSEFREFAQKNNARIAYLSGPDTSAALKSSVANTRDILVEMGAKVR